eukprot:CAMPEP_0183359744 /NCGR_PEP_ID=MMETSP0164_2-20130417/53141_1 /TAXON_ID=221442 /ORGANISM="Coccolithus pelagicus ssp braarudi, Strain PLY182g" /LENGTH=53 /DNA_ID=CAMNT_0025533927 /DNA_START=138 /DNA_END=296 /DNA_ORIENTATION=+
MSWDKAYEEGSQTRVADRRDHSHMRPEFDKSYVCTRPCAGHIPVRRLRRASAA